MRACPEIGRDELIRYFTPMAAELAFLHAKRLPTTMLGVAVQLCTLPWLGFVPDEAPPAAVERLAARLDIAADELVGYGEREQTRTGHLREVLTYRRWRTPDQQALKKLDEFLLARAMEQTHHRCCSGWLVSHFAP